MFGTMGFSELIIILVIVLIIFGAGKLPQIGEGVGKALRGFKKEVHDMPPPESAQSPSDQPAAQGQVAARPSIEEARVAAPSQSSNAPPPTAPYTPGPELTPGTTAALMANLGPQAPNPKTAAAGQSAPTPASQPAATVHGQQPISMEDRMAAPTPVSRAQYPPLPPGAQAKPVAKRPSAVVNKDAVARVQAQQAAIKAKAAQQPQQSGVSPEDMQSLGEGLGDALRTFRQAVADVRNSVDPEMRTIRAEMDAAQKEIEQSMEAAKEMPAVQEEPPKPA
ncbi:MAG: twin-arginine translocase TatA/TatE family subunit [Nitrospiraceae bacterium]